MIVLVQFVQVPYLDNRIYPRFIFLWGFWIKNKTNIQQQSKNPRNFIHTEGSSQSYDIFISTVTWEIPVNACTVQQEGDSL
jgi:hypothetical protein